ncbi:MAG: hypothetical protein PHC75_06260, partial [Burkholderiales bacterium]|nr:hypothetical protein [Burkholderiales bacterium]
TNGAVRENTQATAIGSARAPISADPIITDVVFSPAASGGDGKASGSAFAIAGPQGGGEKVEAGPVPAPVSQTVTLTYQNQGNVDAAGFSVSTMSPNGYTFDGSGSTCNNPVTLQKNSGNSCTMKYVMNTSSSGARNLDMSSILANWTTEEEENPTDNHPINWAGNSSPLVYVNLYTPPSVQALLIDVTNGQQMAYPYKVNVGSYVKIQFNLSGGYYVGNTTYTASASGYSPVSANCTVSSNNPSCQVTLQVPNKAMASTTITLTGNPMPMPSTFNVEVVAQ